MATGNARSTPTEKAIAYSIHLLTASGAGFALFAMLAAGNKDWAVMYLWLLGALIVDGIDGPLARKYDVARHAPQWDGVLLDLIIDYLTYVFIPAYALAQSGIMDPWLAWLSAIVMTLTSAVYFADSGMKTADKSFAGFPGCWNMVVLVFFALTPPDWLMAVIVVVLALLQFTPVIFIHPVRTQRLRHISLPIMFLWTASAIAIGWVDFEPGVLSSLIILVSSLYLVAIGAIMQVFKQ